MRKVSPIFIIIIISLSFGFEYKTFELIGKVTSEQGIAITDTYVQIWDKGEVIAQTKTDNLGQYTLPLPKIGTFTVMAGNRNKYFHAISLKEYSFHIKAQFKENFFLEIDKQELQDETVRLRESYHLMIHNFKNSTHRRKFINRFPKSGTELELFFSVDVKEKNLKKEAKRYISTLFQERFTGRTTYFLLFIRFAQKTDMRVAGKSTKKFYDEAVTIIKKYPKQLFDELSTSKPERVSNFFKWMFSGGAFGKNKITKEFDFLQGKYKREYAIMLDEFDAYQ